MSVVSDEIDQDLDRACQVARELGMHAVELNTLWGKPVDQLTAGEVSRVATLVDRYGLKVSCVSVASLKAIEFSEQPDLTQSAQFAEHLEMITNAARVADALAGRMLARHVRIFSFRREPMQGLGNPWPILSDGGGIDAATLTRIVQGLDSAADLAKKLGVRLLIENVRSCWGNSGANTAAILRAANRPELRAIWDIGNDYVSCGQRFYTGYRALTGYIEAVHWKDAAVLDWSTGLTAWMPVGEGGLDVPGQMAAFAVDGLPGPFVLETHWRGEHLSKEASSRHSFAGLQRHMTAAGIGYR
jgi:sugar phosphate isomerase/epimerase